MTTTVEPIKLGRDIGAKRCIFEAAASHDEIVAAMQDGGAGFIGDDRDAFDIDTDDVLIANDGKAYEVQRTNEGALALVETGIDGKDLETPAAETVRVVFTDISRYHLAAAMAERTTFTDAFNNSVELREGNIVELTDGVFDLEDDGDGTLVLVPRESDDDVFGDDDYDDADEDDADESDDADGDDENDEQE